LFDSSFKNSEYLDTSKYLLKECSRGLIPTKIIERKKKGFPVPLDNWFAGSLNKFAKDILLDGETKRRGIFNLNEIENLMQNKEKIDYDFWGKKIWMLVNIELWYRNTVK
jgi:asparagine synthase (glutamine-hydrolysing)